MLTLINWLSYKIVANDEAVKRNLWLRLSMEEYYRRNLHISIVLDVIITFFSGLWLWAIYAN